MIEAIKPLGSERVPLREAAGRYLSAPALAPRAMAHYAVAGVHVFSWPDQLVEAARACAAAGRVAELAAV